MQNLDAVLKMIGYWMAITLIRLF